MKDIISKVNGITQMRKRNAPSGFGPGCSPLSYPKMTLTTKKARADKKPLERVMNPATAV